MENGRKLIILRGNSGSGKTTVAKLLQEKFGPNTMRISHDMIRMEMLHVWSREGIEKSLPLMINLLRYGKQHSQVTVLEGILPCPEYLPLFQAALEEYGQDIYSYYYDLPFEETLRRHGTKPNRDEFGEPEMRRWWKEKDYLDIIPQTILHQGLGPDEAVELIYGHATAGSCR
ncbi:zeta toxin family protein [uncultured Acetatifactor sp.]|uniref:zeta toxin family protein n=1 Tax=uncultured Acetatifactor sp. TaxID=1671927 RepID=UPI00263718D9|nr:zeta toxin family protein [uncultured Acetatifactor sp.]